MSCNGLSEELELLSEKLPWPIACPLAVAQDTSQVTLRRFEHLLFAYSQYLRVVGLGLLSQYFHQDKVIPSMVRAIRAMRSPHLSDWLTLIGTATKHLPLPCFPSLKNDLAKIPKFEVVWPEHPKTGVFQHPTTLLRDVRNRLWGHAVPLMEGDLALVTEHYLEVLTALLQGSHFLHEASIYQRLDDPSESDPLDCLGESFGIHAVLLEGQQPRLLQKPMVLRPPYSDNPSNSPLFLRTPSGDWPLYPLFVSRGGHGLASGDPVLLFDGHSRKQIVYIGVSTRIDSGHELDFYERLLARKQVDLRISADEVRMRGLASFATYWTSERLAEITGTKYLPQTYVERDCADGVVKRFLAQNDKPAMLVTAGPGSGKTSLFCHLADKLLQGESNDVVVLIPGHLVRASETSTNDPFRVLGEALGLASDIGSMRQLMSLLQEHRKSEGDGSFYLLVDAVNESEVPRTLLTWLDELASLVRPLGWVRILASFRDEAWRALQARERSFEELHPAIRYVDAWFRVSGDELEYRLPSFSDEEVQKAFDRYASVETSPWAGQLPPWETINLATRSLLSKPINILLYCQLDPTERSVQQDERALHSAYARHAASSLRDPGVLYALIDDCLASGSPAVSAKRIEEERMSFVARYAGNPAAICAYLDPIELLTDRGLLLRHFDEGEILVRFAHQAILEALVIERLRAKDPALGPRTLQNVLEVTPSPLPEGVNAVAQVLAFDMSLGDARTLLTLDTKYASILAAPMAGWIARHTNNDELLTAAFNRVAALAEWRPALLDCAETLFRNRRTKLALRTLAALGKFPLEIHLQAQTNELAATCLYFEDDLQGSLDAIDSAIKVHRDLGAKREEASCLMRRSYTCYYLRMHADAGSDFFRARSLLEEGGWNRDLAILLKNAGTLREGSHAAPLIEEAITLFEAEGEKALAATSRVNLSVELYIAGRIKEALRAATLGLRSMREVGNTSRINAGLNNLGLAQLALGDNNAALASFRAAHPLCYEGWERAAVANNLAATLKVCGDLDGAAAFLEEAEQYAEKSADPSVPARLILTRMGMLTSADTEERMKLLSLAEAGFLATMDLRGLAITLGFAKEMGASRYRLESAIEQCPGGHCGFLSTLRFYPWHIVLFE